MPYIYLYIYDVYFTYAMSNIVILHPVKKNERYANFQLTPRPKYT